MRTHKGFIEPAAPDKGSGESTGSHRSALASTEEALIDPAPLDEEHKAALWLYAEALRERRSDGMLADIEPPPRAL
jgi:hypothetical protein